MTRILIVNGHPDPSPAHFIHGAATAYEEGAAAAHEVRRIDIGRLQFPLIRSQDEWTNGEPPPDIREAQEALRWADHVVLFYPMWLGDVPALLKGLLEQVMRPDFAFRYRENGSPEKLLAGKSARIVVSMGMPGFAYALFYRAHSLKSLKSNVFGSSGSSRCGTPLSARWRAARPSARSGWPSCGRWAGGRFDLQLCYCEALATSYVTLVSGSRSKLWVWAVLALPGAVALVRYALTPDAWPGDMLHPTGEWSARFIILALMVTPLRQLFPRSRAVAFLARHRRALGVAGFLYALAHLLFYVLDMETLGAMLAELGAPSIWTGWLALALLIPLGLTSNDAAVRALRSGWKRLQRLAYPMALLTLVHWALIHDGLIPAMVHFLPLALLQAWRVARYFQSRPTRSLA